MDRPDTQATMTRVGLLDRSSRPAHRRASSLFSPRRLIVVAVLVAPLVAGEIGVRALIATHQLPIAAAHQAAIEVAWTNHDQQGPTDILILGDSLARMGIHPRTLAGLAEGAAGRPVTAYNLSAPGTGFPVYRAFLEQLGRERRLPKVVVIGISTVGLQRSDEQSARALHSPFGRLVSNCSMVAGVEETLSCRLESVSALWRWRGQPTRLAEALVASVPAALVDGGITLEVDGYASSLPMRPKTLDRQLALALQNLPPLANADPNVQEYIDLVDAAWSRGVRVVSVLVPYSPPLEDALEAREPGWRAHRTSMLERLGEQAGQPILDNGPLNPWTVHDSHDTRHFSLPGAQRFTQQLWQTRAFRKVIVEAVRGP